MLDLVATDAVSAPPRDPSIVPPEEMVTMYYLEDDVNPTQDTYLQAA